MLKNVPKKARKTVYILAITYGRASDSASSFDLIAL